MNPPRANTVGVHRWQPTLNKQKKLRKQVGSLAGRPQWVPRPPTLLPLHTSSSNTQAGWRKRDSQSMEDGTGDRGKMAGGGRRMKGMKAGEWMEWF